MKSLQRKLVLVLIFSLFSIAAKAGDSIMLQAVKPEQIDRCQIVKDNFLPVSVGEITWDSPDRSVGVTSTKEGSEPVILSEKLETILADSFKNFLGKCQFKTQAKGQNAIVLDITIQDFFVKAKNDVVVGKTDGSLRLSISYNNANDGTYTVSTFSVEREYKTGPSKKLKRLEKIVSQLLVDGINEVAASRSFYDTIELLSKK